MRPLYPRECKVSRLFGAYIVIAFSAAEAKKTGDSSAWIGVVKPDVRFRPVFESHNPPSRAEALILLKHIMAELHKRGEKIFLGFDFALGMVRGTSMRLQLQGDTPWQAMWTFLSKNVVDKPDNTNNRFALAARLNRLMTDEAYPFWGCPKSAAQKWLASVKPESYRDFPEFRLTEAAMNKKHKGLFKSLWQMHGAGTGGGRTMLGIRALVELKAELSDNAKIWPFETGFEKLKPEDLDGVNTLIAEVAPHQCQIQIHSGEFKDEAILRTNMQQLAEWDEKGLLASMFAAPKGLSDSELDAVSKEEGWVLGA